VFIDYQKNPLVPLSNLMEIYLSVLQIVAFGQTDEHNIGLLDKMVVLFCKFL